MVHHHVETRTGGESTMGGYVIERTIIESVRIERKEMKTLEDWKAVVFESSIAKTPEFLAFAKMYKARVKQEAERYGLELVSWSTEHFYCSAFLKNLVTGKLVYISCSDVRHFPGDWYSEILIRTAKHEKDYTGGINCYATLETVGSVAERLTSGEETTYET